MSQKSLKKILIDRQRKRFKDRVEKERKLYMERLHKELSEESNLSEQQLREKLERRKELLNFIDSYVFINKLQPLIAKDEKLDVKNDYGTVKDFLRIIINFRGFLRYIPTLKSFLFIFSFFFFFLIEYWFHYYSFISLKDIDITYQAIIDKFPPFK